MQWTVLRAIIESRAYWSLNALFIVVPLISRIGLPVHWELIASYLAAWCLLVAGILFYIVRPNLIRFHDFAEYSASGYTSGDLISEFQKSGAPMPTSQPLATLLGPNNTDPRPDRQAFWFVANIFDGKNPSARWIASAFIAAAAALLLAVNVHRFYGVVVRYYESQESKNVATHRNLVPIGTEMRVGDPVEVIHEDGSGAPKTTKGKLLNADENGYLVVQVDGKVVYIPNRRVIRVEQDAA